MDYTQYRLYLERANKNDIPVWEVAYKFKEFYGVKDMSPESFKIIADKILTDPDTFKKMAKMLIAEGTRYDKTISAKCKIRI